MITCPLCDGPGVELGILGNLQHLRCRDCGVTYADLDFIVDKIWSSEVQ
jgi:transposase-like protein